MRLLKTGLFLLLLSFPLPVEAARYTPMNLADMVERLTPAVVNISSTQVMRAPVLPIPMFDPNQLPQGMEQFRDLLEQFRPYGDQLQVERKAKSLGSGFIVSADGYIVTNNHVIAKADEIQVTLSDNSEYKATVVGTDTKTDLALLKIESSKPLPFVEFGDSDRARVGDWVVVIGNPFGLGGSVSAGIISARARDINAGPFDDFLQTDAAINSGNSGGPMFNLDGQVVGISTAIFTPTGGNVGIGFATPSALAKPVIDQLKNHGYARRAWLGVKIQQVSKEIADSLGLPSTDGVLVVEVTPGSPSEQSGMQSGDIITHFNAKEVGEFRRFPRLVAESPMGRPISVTVWRDGRARPLSVTLTESEDGRPAKPAEAKKPAAPAQAPSTGAVRLLGMQLQGLSANERAQAGLQAGEEGGLRVIAVERQSEAWQRGVRQGDIVVRINETPVVSVQVLRDALAKARQERRQFVLLRLQRGQNTHFVTLPTN